MGEARKKVGRQDIQRRHVGSRQVRQMDSGSRHARPHAGGGSLSRRVLLQRRHLGLRARGKVAEGAAPAERDGKGRVYISSSGPLQLQRRDQRRG